MNSSPGSPVGLGAVVADQLTSIPPYGFPHEPGLRSWSAGLSTVTMPSSVEPYTSKRKPSPSFSITSCFSAYGTGAALATSSASTTGRRARAHPAAG